MATDFKGMVSIGSHTLVVGFVGDGFFGVGAVGLRIEGCAAKQSDEEKGYMLFS